MEKYKTFFDEIIDLDALSPEAKKIYGAVKKCYEDNIDKDPEPEGSEFYNTEWVRLLNTYLEKIRELRNAKGGGPLVLEEALHKLYTDLDTRFCLKKQEQRQSKSDGKSDG